MRLKTLIGRHVFIVGKFKYLIDWLNNIFYQYFYWINNFSGDSSDFTKLSEIFKSSNNKLYRARCLVILQKIYRQIFKFSFNVVKHIKLEIYLIM